MTRRAFVIGLGLESGVAVQNIRRVFAAQMAADALDTLWILPYLPADTHSYEDLETFIMGLDRTALRKRYYQPEVRKWSGPNWKNWGGALASNRMFGRLAAYNHIGRLADHLTTRVNTLTVSDREAVNVYLIAPLHDPFASGAMIDVAYLLHDLALKRRASVYGLLILPDMQDDPLSITDEDKHASQLRAALTYAALRELHFYLGPESFYHTHTTDLQLTFYDQSPFQTGDCLLIGGEKGEPEGALIYSDVIQQTASWVYLHTRTPLAEKMPPSDNNRGVVSSFGLVQSNINADTPQIDHEAQPRTLALLRTLSRITEQNDLVSEMLRRWTDTRFIVNFDTQRPDEPGDDVSSDMRELRDAVRILDARYRQEARRLLEREEQLAAEMNERLQREAIRDMQDDINRLITLPGLTLQSLNQNLAHIRSEMQQQYRQGKTDLRSLERESEQKLKQVLTTRLQYEFTTDTDADRRFLFALAAMTIFWIAFVLFLSGLFVQMFTWGIAAAVIPTSMAYVVQVRRQNNEKIAFSSAQRELLNVQRRIINQRITNAYLHALLTAFEQMTTTSVTTRGQQRINAITKAIDGEIKRLEGKRISASNLSRSDEKQNASQLLIRLWELSAQHPLDAENVEQEAAALFDDDPGSGVDADVKDQALGLVQYLYTKSRSFLATNIALIHEVDKERVEYIVGLYHWPEPLVTSLQRQLDEQQIIHVIGEMEKSFRVPDDLRGMLLVRIRNNISLRALLNIERWRNDFYHICTYQAPDWRFTYRSWLHPTRIGVAVPDVVTATSTDQEQMSVWFVMAVVILLRETVNANLRETLARKLGVPDRSSVNEDELCAALASDRVQNDELGRLIQTAFEATQHHSRAHILAAFEAQVSALNPIFSETYADWQAWVVRKLRDLVTLIRKREPHDVEWHIALSLGRLILYLQAESATSTIAVDEPQPQ